jgi:hypothetical protein
MDSFMVAFLGLPNVSAEQGTQNEAEGEQEGVRSSEEAVRDIGGVERE